MGRDTRGIRGLCKVGGAGGREEAGKIKIGQKEIGSVCSPRVVVLLGCECFACLRGARASAACQPRIILVNQVAFVFLYMQSIVCGDYCTLGVVKRSEPGLFSRARGPWAWVMPRGLSGRNASFLGFLLRFRR